VSTNLPDALAEYAEIVFLAPEKCKFSMTAGGFLALEYGEDKFPVVSAYRSFPLTLGDKYISIRDDKEKEIGIIVDLADFSSDQANLVRAELERRYFTPVVETVVKMKEEFGYIYWEVITDRGPRRFTSRGQHDSIVPVSDTRILILDVDGNRFDVPDVRLLDAKSAKLLESLM
jgi:hypothetical protein